MAKQPSKKSGKSSKKGDISKVSLLMQKASTTV